MRSTYSFFFLKLFCDLNSVFKMRECDGNLPRDNRTTYPVLKVKLVLFALISI